MTLHRLLAMSAIAAVLAIAVPAARADTPYTTSAIACLCNSTLAAEEMLRGFGDVPPEAVGCARLPQGLKVKLLSRVNNVLRGAVTLEDGSIRTGYLMNGSVDGPEGKNLHAWDASLAR